MAKAPEATVIDLQSHPLWIASQRRERQLEAAIRRHPAHIGRKRALASGETMRPAALRYQTADAPA